MRLMFSQSFTYFTSLGYQFAVGNHFVRGKYIDLCDMFQCKYYGYMSLCERSYYSGSIGLYATRSSVGTKKVLKEETTRVSSLQYCAGEERIKSDRNKVHAFLYIQLYTAPLSGRQQLPDEQGEAIQHIQSQIKSGKSLDIITP